MKEAAISYSPHAYVPKRTLTEEERVELYRTRIDASFKPYTVIDVLQKVYHRSFEDDLLSAVTLHPEWFQPPVDGWKLARAWIRSLRIIRPESIFFQKTSDFQVDIAIEARICMEQARCGNALLKRRCNAEKRCVCATALICALQNELQLPGGCDERKGQPAGAGLHGNLRG